VIDDRINMQYCSFFENLYTKNRKKEIENIKKDKSKVQIFIGRK
jgi:hypothetical protein